MNRTDSLTGKAMVITGAGRGIGAVVAQRAAGLGAFVVVNDIDADVASETVARIEELGGSAIAHCGDISDPNYCERLIEACIAERGQIDALVNNAGLFRMGPAWDLNPADLQTMIAVNVLGTAHCAMHAIPRMRAAGKGSIINVTSGAASGIAEMSAYGATKGAVSSMTYGWALDLTGSGVRVNAVSPNATTRMVAAMQEFKGIQDQPRPFQDPQHTAETVCFLASDRSAHVNGQIIRIASGQLSLVAQPKPIQPGVSVADWSIDTVAQAVQELIAGQ
ncbi:SDR family NAD(P)-dependent oxidoreductase [Sphingorhabdus lacus]|uniref:SDR family oxidoreductase n=1 Tax=Sphingorhabdus lacus TaxID=392610 RepID=A0A6I6L4N9_9SPHN|nr:SDR family oxidoreductase [Sphingorhabdus lacus]QGY80649.1 SDR family oxidoreductase [Sphingorhabdus lacus]